MSGKHVASRELRAVLHHLHQDVLSIPTYERYIAEVDDQSAPLQSLAGTRPGTFHFGGPWGNKRPF